HRFAPLEEKRPDLPVALVELVRRALESAPEARPSAREVARGLEAVARALGRRRLVPAGKVKRYRRVAAALVAVSLLLAGAIGFAGWRRGSVHAERVETARSLAELARARLAADDVGALLLARAAQGFEAASGEALDPGCDATLALAALARGSDALSVAAATSALAREPSRREELLLVRGRARLGLRDVDGVLEDVRGLATPDARRLRIQALLVGRRWTDILALEGTDAFLAAARVAARLDGELARAPLGQIETAFADARRAVHDEPEITALLFEMAARAEIAGVASLIGVTRERLPSEFAVDPVRYTKDRNLLFDPIVAATHALEEALKRPRHLLDVASELDSIDLALAVLETNPFNLRTNPDGQDLDAPRKRGELKALACELEGVAVAIAPGPADALSHRVRTFLVIQWLWDRNDPERRAFLEANVGKGPPAVDSYLRVGLLLAVERDFLSGRTPAREAVEEFEKHLDKIDPSLPTPSGEVSLRAHFEELTAELSVRAMTEEPAAAAARLETAARHQAEGRRILERAGKAVVRSESLGRDILRAAAEVALAGRDLAAAERAIEELASAEKTRDAPELLFRAEVMKRKGDLEAAARFVADAERAPDDVMRMGTERDWFQLDWYVERLLLEHGRGAVDARERLESLRRDRRPPLLPWIDEEVRKLIGG
ncbi:MAG TPA: hypothetical protein VFF73_14145, partial [Planctomycetota bacterium]|nr:hypothetical protein [Planctomycetota bacterium]